MPSIQQIIAEIQLAPDLPPNHKVKAVQIIRDAEQRLKLKGVNSKPRKPSGKGLVALEDWEAADGWQKSQHGMAAWIDRHHLDSNTVNEMVDEFRREMKAKGKQYANFAMAFQTYLRKGYLSKPMTACVKKENTHIDRKGVTL